MNIDNLAISTIRVLSAEAIQKANSGHPGLPLGCAPMAYTLWAKQMKHNPKNPLWEDRDRFVLSAGHGSMLIYSLLNVFGYDLSVEDIKGFRQYGSKTPGHPEYKHTDGVETVSYTHLRAHETDSYLVCRLLLEKKKITISRR